MEDYNLIGILSPEIVSLDSDKYGTQVWAVSNLTKKHKDDKCAMCEGRVGNKAYRPTTNKYNRGDRICIQCIEGLKVVFSQKEGQKR